jgi:peptide-methionine (S)-S-oxide reductase
MTEGMQHGEIATFGGGCFWGVEETFRSQKGVISTAVGYMGGTMENPNYEAVCTDATGHAEVVQVTFNPKIVSYEKLLEIFWKNHNPTTKDRQGPDVGTQYRSVIFTHSKEQEKIAEASKTSQEKSGKWKSSIVTHIVPAYGEASPATTFWKAEEYHQQYLAKRGLSSCHF